MSFKRYRIIFILIFMLLNGTFGDIDADRTETTKQHMINGMENVQSDNKEGRALFPRTEYTNEGWSPVGRGDPLKDPTYDYMPPVLDRVRYWAEGTSHKNKNDVLVLGVPSKKLSSIKQKEKHSYGPVKRTYYSQPYQTHFSAPHYHTQSHQQQHIPQRMMPPPMHTTSSYPLSTHHYRPSLYQTQHAWKMTHNVYTEPRPENSIIHMSLSKPLTPTTRHPSTGQFLPTLLSSDQSQESSSPAPFMSSIMATNKQNEALNGHMMPSSLHKEHLQRDTTKPLLQSILQTETAAPFTKKPSSVYQIEYPSSIYNPQAINSMATSSSYVSTFNPTKATVQPMPMNTTTKTSLMSLSSDATTISAPLTTQEQKQYIQPEMHMGWPVYNLIIEGHSKVKTYGGKNDDSITSNLPKIRPIQSNENPIVEYVTNPIDGPEYKSTQAPQRFPNNQDIQKSSMLGLLSLLEGSFGNLLSDDSIRGNVEVRHKSENKNAKNEHFEKRKTRRSIPDEQQERVLNVSFQVDEIVNNQQQQYHRGTVISENLFPFHTADKSR